MQYRKLGRTGTEIGLIGLGAEYLEKAPREAVVSVVHEALDNGVNYIDLFMASPGVRDNFGHALAGRREDVLVAGHLGCTYLEGQYARSRDGALCEAFLHDMLIRLRTDHLGVLMLHYVDEDDDYAQVFGPGGLLEIALRFKEAGKARLLGMSSHQAVVAQRAVESGYLDLLMFPVNPLFDRLPGETSLEPLRDAASYAGLGENGQAVIDRHELYHACARHGVGIVAMKPYAAGWLFNTENPGAFTLTPVQCLSYALAQPGVCTVVPGCKTVEEMRAALAYLSATHEERDFSIIETSPLWSTRQSCMYCNHCLPCPMGIDVAVVTRLADTAQRGLTPALRAEYEALSAGGFDGSACTGCDQCRQRCPFGIDAPANMRRAAEAFRG